MIHGMAPDIGLQYVSFENSRNGFMVRIPSKSGSRESVQTMKDQFFTTHAPRLYNSLPKTLRVRGDSLEVFKAKLDVFMDLIPDNPILAGYTSNNRSSTGKQSNSILDWMRNSPHLSEWEPVISP